MKRSALAMAVVAALVANPCRARDGIGDGFNEAVVKGRQLAGSLCASCHMAPGQGEKQGAMGIPGFAAVANRPAQTHEAIVRWLRSAPPMMPDHKLTWDEADALAEFIMTLREPGPNNPGQRIPGR